MAKCKNCRNMTCQKVVFNYTTTEYPYCPAVEECLDDIDKEIVCSGFEGITNADRIRSMTDEELRDFMYDMTSESQCHVCAFKKGWLCEKPYDKSCHDGVMKWLKLEVGCE